MLENPNEAELVRGMEDLHQLTGQVKELHTAGVRVTEDGAFSPYGLTPVFSYVRTHGVRAGTGGTFRGPGWSV